jgi:hypothetical protein
MKVKRFIVAQAREKNEFTNSKKRKMTFMERLISGICGAGIVLLWESEHSCLKLFKRRTTLFFFVCQLAIWSSALLTALAVSVYFLPNLRVLPMLVIILITKCMQNMSYPLMILLRLRFIRDFPVIIMYIPVVLSAILAAMRFFWIRWILTGETYYFNVFFIIQPITTIIITIQNIVINVFFIVIAIEKFQNVVHIRFVVIVNIIVITLECVKALIEFLTTNAWVTLCVISIVSQVKVRLEIDILSYIVQSVASVHDQHISSEVENEMRRNNFCHALDFFSSRSRAAGLA